MGFLEAQNATPNPAQAYYRWSGGLKNVTLSDGTEAKQLKGELVFFNGEEMEATDLPFEFCLLDQSASVTGYNPNGDARFYSNEFTSNKEIVRVTKDTDGNREVVAEDYYANLKGHLPEGAKYQSNLYVYVPAHDRIERLNLKGSALSAWIEFGQKNKGIYNHTVKLDAGEKKTMGTVEFIAPKFEFGQEYDDTQKEQLTKYATVVSEYLKTKRQANLENAGEPDVQIDQTPTQYEGEQSQETPTEEEKEEGGITLSDVPF